MIISNLSTGGGLPEKILTNFRLKRLIGEDIHDVTGKNYVQKCRLQSQKETIQYNKELTPDQRSDRYIFENIENITAERTDPKNKGQKYSFNRITDQFCCNYVHYCPFCRAVTMQKRAQQIFYEINKDCYHYVLTIQHRRQSKLKDLIQVLRGAVRYTLQDRQFRRDNWQDFKYIAVLEVCYSNYKNGLHPHLHFLLWNIAPDTIIQLDSKIKEYYKKNNIPVNEKTSYFDDIVISPGAPDFEDRIYYCFMDALSLGEKENSIFYKWPTLPRDIKENYINGVKYQKLLQTKGLKLNELDDIGTADIEKQVNPIYKWPSIYWNMIPYPERIEILKYINAMNGDDIFYLAKSLFFSAEKIKKLEKNDIFAKNHNYIKTNFLNNAGEKTF